MRNSRGPLQVDEQQRVRKTMENLHKRVDVKLVWPREGEKLRKLVAKLSFNSSVILGEAG